MTNSVPFCINGRRTQTSDVPDVSHVSISNGRPLPSMSTNARSMSSRSAALAFCMAEYENPEGEFAAIRTRTGKPESAGFPTSYPATVSFAP